MWKKLIATGDGWSPLVLRAALGTMILPHGAQKLLGWFGGPGPGATMEYLIGTLGIPALLAAAVIVVEFFGGLALLAGVLGRLSALSVGAVLTGAAVTVHAQYGFFMNWTGARAGEGWEFHLLAVAMALALVLEGSGRWSVDGWFARRHSAS